MSFRTALSGLSAANANLGVISNNIANNNTTGFKQSRAEFGDIFSLSNLGMSSSRSIGSGVKLNAVTQQFTQGNLETTGNALDLGLNGEGFFMLKDGGATVYTRAGGFSIDKDGYIVNSAGRRLQGFTALDDGGFTAGTGDIYLDTSQNNAKATTNTQFGVNLDSAATVPTVIPFDYKNTNSFNYSTSSSFYDSQGGSHTLTAYFVKNGLNSWTAYYSADGKDPSATPSVTNFTFDANGQLVSPTSSSIAVNLTTLNSNNGATSPMNISLDFTGSTQFGSASATNSITQDGFASGELVGLNVDEDGTIFGNYSNGQSKPLAMVAIANFRNQQGLSPVGDTAWAQTAAAGEVIIGQAGTSSLGVVQSGTLEVSNVELTEQLVNMISAQRDFQANSQVISTNDEMTQTILNLR